jgi:hypothetical protein
VVFVSFYRIDLLLVNPCYSSLILNAALLIVVIASYNLSFVVVSVAIRHMLILDAALNLSLMIWASVNQPRMPSVFHLHQG